MTYMILWALFWGIIGSFGTAFIHQKTGRDVQMGGLIGSWSVQSAVSSS
jgi:hypothetical protein